MLVDVVLEGVGTEALEDQDAALVLDELMVELHNVLMALSEALESGDLK